MVGWLRWVILAVYWARFPWLNRDCSCDKFAIFSLSSRATRWRRICCGYLRGSVGPQVALLQGEVRGFRAGGNDADRNDDDSTHAKLISGVVGTEKVSWPTRGH